MRTFLPLLSRRVALVVAFVALAWFALGAGSPRALADGTGTITGVVQNGTHGNAVVAGQQVILQLTLGSTIKDVATTTADAQGHFSFTGLDGATLGGSYAVYTRYQGGIFSAGPFDLSTNPTQDVTLPVYDATQDSSNLSVSMATILVRQPDAKHGIIGVGEFLTIHNSGTTAFVGALPSGGGGAMPSLLRFSLPAHAENVTTGVGFFNTDVIAVGTGFGAAATVPPGQTEFAFAYDLPYTSTTLSIPYKAEYPTAQVVALVPPTLLVRSASGVTAQGIVSTFGSRYQVYTANDVAHDANLSVNLYDLPQPGERQYLNTPALLWLAAGIVALLALLLALYLWRGALAVTLGLIPATAPALATTAAGASDASHADERDRLLHALLACEQRRARGSISAEQFKREDASLRERLRALLLEEQSEASALTVAANEALADATAETAPSGGQR